MIAEAGQFALALALVVALAQVGLAFWRAAPGDTRGLAATLAAAEVQAMLVLTAFAALTFAYITSDFSVRNVFENSHTAKPLLYKITGVWGNHEGSMVLWVLILALFGFLVARFAPALPLALRARALAVQAMIAAAFLLFILLAANPFERLLPVPGQGNDLNPLLQDPGLAFHPPLLYLGYVGFSIVFAFAAAGLIEGRIDEAWARFVRPWVLIAWTSLTLGIALGSWWAYYELGWGGYWFWDPVENASLMPWLAGTALLHSITVLEKRGALKSWTVFLAILAFSLSLLGTFLVRSGVIVSVHAFASDPTRGLFILGILAIAVGGALALFAWRQRALGEGRAFGLVSRESFLLANNVLLSTACAIVVLGTLFPLLYIAFTGNQLSVGPPYFHVTFAPVAVALLVLVPLGSIAPWKEADLSRLAARQIPSALAAIGLATIAFALWTPRDILGAAGLALAAWLIFGSLQDLWQRTRRDGFSRVPLQVYGMVVAHMGLGLLTAGVTGVGAWQIEGLAALAPGASTRLGALTLTLEKVETVAGPNYTAERGLVRVSQGDRVIAVMAPERRFYPSQRMTTTEAAIRTNLLGDIYVVLGEAQGRDEQGASRHAVRAYVNPLAPWIWLGAALSALGGAISFLARRRVLSGAREPRLPIASAPARSAASP